MLEYRLNPSDFTRNRCLTIERTIGLLLSMVCERNGNGYDIASQNFFSGLSRHLDEVLDPARRQSVGEARAKLSWKAFEFLLERANLESDGLPKHLKFRGHVTRAIDSTTFYTPASKELLQRFSRRKPGAGSRTHYPYCLCLSAINVYTGQPTGAVVDDYLVSERALLIRMIQGFAPGDLALLDRGLGGGPVYLQFHLSQQFFIHRTKSTGKRGTATWVREFVASGKKQKIVQLTIQNKITAKAHKMKVRLILGPEDSEGKPIVFVTNLLNPNRYTRDDIISLYCKRWKIEPLYGRVKNLLNIEKFPARSHNGVLQEIFSNFLVLSLTAAALVALAEKDGVDLRGKLPSFKNATEVVRRNLLRIVVARPGKTCPRELLDQILREVRLVTYTVRPGRSFPRVSMQPVATWSNGRRLRIATYKKNQEAKSLT